MSNPTPATARPSLTQSLIGRWQRRTDPRRPTSHRKRRFTAVFLITRTLGIAAAIMAAGTSLTGPDLNPAAAQTAENTVALTATDQPPVVLHESPVLPRVRLTPPVDEVAGLERFRLDLSGPWEFCRDLPEPFNGQDRPELTWGSVEIPGHFALQGYAPLGPEPGAAVAYRKTFALPADWAGRSVVLRFGSIDGRVRLWVNGRAAGSSDSAFLPVEFEIDPYLRPGQDNQIALSVEVSELTGWYLRELGGMGRPVTLTALPTHHLSRLHVETPGVVDRPGDDPAAARDTVVRLTRVNRSATAVADARLRLRVLDARGLDAVPPRVLPLQELPGGDREDLTFTLAVPEAVAWNPERPVLYRLEAALMDHGDRPALVVSRPFGFRSVWVDGHRLRVNGQAVELVGANYHLTHRGHGHFVPGPLIERDLEILKRNHVNALRAWPTPYREYVDTCNRIGLLTTVEMPLNLQIYAKGPRKDHGNDPALEGPVLELAARMLETYRSDPSVLLWGLGNECPYHDYFQRAARGIAAADPGRPIFFGGDLGSGVGRPGTQINDEHYPRGGTTTLADLGHITGEGWRFPTDRPAISSEWLHLNINNRAQLLLDPGVDDYWGFYAKAHQDWAWRTDHFAGGFTFLSAPYRGMESKTLWRGYFDDDRRPTPYLWHARRAGSPVQLDHASLRPDADGGRVAFELTNRHNFTDLSELDFRWHQGDAGGALAVSGLPHRSASAAVPWDPGGGPLWLTAASATGEVVDRFCLIDSPPTLPPPGSDAAVRILEPSAEAGSAQRVDTGGVVWHLDPTTGLLRGLTIPGVDADAAADAAWVPLTGPHLTVRGHGHPNPDGQTGNIRELCRRWRLDESTLRQDGPRVVAEIRGRYDHAEGTITLAFCPGDRLEVAYDFRWTWQTPSGFPQFDQGIRFAVPSEYDTLVWSRRALHLDYPEDHIGRPHGRAPARGDPRWRMLRDDAPPDATPTWPWSQDLAGPPESDGQVTRDFRATRLHVFYGGLVDPAGRGLLAISDATQHVRALPAADAWLNDDEPRGYTVQLNDYFEGGSDFHSSKSLLIERRTLSPGTRLAGRSAWRWTTVPVTETDGRE